jgi:hypothetical protein
MNLKKEVPMNEYTKPIRFATIESVDRRNNKAYKTKLLVAGTEDDIIDIITNNHYLSRMYMEIFKKQWMKSKNNNLLRITNITLDEQIFGYGKGA